MQKLHGVIIIVVITAESVLTRICPQNYTAGERRED